jgi:hypothetical protein
MRATPTQEPQKIDLTNQARALVRLAQATAVYGGHHGMFGPGSPITPINGEDDPRLFEYQPGINLTIIPRVGFGAQLSFPALRALGQVKEIRLNIELIKRQICGMEWEIVPAETRSVEIGDDIYERVVDTDSVREFFEKPDGTNDWDAWLKMVLEELLVIDALTLYPEYDHMGRLVEINVVDGATIRPLLDYRGRVPRPPMPAYTQVLYGMPSTWYAADRLIYKPLNTKSTSPYGETGAEWVITTINTAIRKEASRLGYFTEGNIPGAIVYLGDLTADQVKVIEEYADALIRGDIARASKLLFLPGGGSGTSVFPFQQNSQDNTTLDSWLMQVACWAFGNSPAEFGLVPGAGLGGAGFMEGSENIQHRSMIGPISEYVTRLINGIIRNFMRRRDVKFQFKSAAPQADRLQQAQVDQFYIGSVYTADYVADREGVPQKYRVKAQPTQANPTPFIPTSYMPFVKRALQGELNSWRGKAIRSFERGAGVATFESEIIPRELNEAIVDGLAKAQSADDIDVLFKSMSSEPELILQKSLVIDHDPTRQVKQTVEQEMEKAIAEYFEGLRQRIIQATVT